jgi:hypothetical protein
MLQSSTVVGSMVRLNFCCNVPTGDEGLTPVCQRRQTTLSICTTQALSHKVVSFRAVRAQPISRESLVEDQRFVAFPFRISVGDLHIDEANGTESPNERAQR